MNMPKSETYSKSGIAFFVIVSVFFLPSVLAAWLLSLSFRTHVGGVNVVTPTRWLLSTLLPISFAFRGLSKQSLSFSGAIAALYVGFMLTISNYCFCSSLLVFFFTSSKLTKFRSHQKEKQEEDHTVGGSRNWVQVLCNGGVPSALAFLYLLDNGCGEVSINLSTSERYISSWLSVAVLGSIACACGDTWASEIGSVMGNGLSTLITTGKKVPAGTNGGVTIFGTMASGLGGMSIGLSYFVTLKLLGISGNHQWLIILTGMLSGLLGSFIDSVFGATLQFSGINETTKKVVSTPGPNIKKICGINLLDNHMVNAITCFLMAFLAPPLESMLERIF